MKRGLFITFEGPDGAGKSTQIAKVGNFLDTFGADALFTREPGGTVIGEKLRDIILDRNHKEMEPMTEAFLYASARAQLVREVLKPALAAGKIVICDRYIDSSIAYQGYARGLGDAIGKINAYATDGLMPDLTFLFILDPKIGRSRIQEDSYDRLESQNFDFHSRVAQGYMEISKSDDKRFVVIDATKTADEIWEKIRAVLLDRLEIET